jgi:hypothetical protein
VEEQEEIRKEEDAVLPGEGLRKRPRDRNLLAGRRQKPNERIKASSESRRKLTVEPCMRGSKGRDRFNRCLIPLTPLIARLSIPVFEKVLRHVTFPFPSSSP